MQIADCVVLVILAFIAWISYKNWKKSNIQCTGSCGSCSRDCKIDWNSIHETIKAEKEKK